MKVFVQQFKKMLCHLVGYYEQGVLYRFVYSADGISLQAAKPGYKPMSIILARATYQEQVLSFPLDDKRELSKLLKLQYAQPQYRYHIIQQKEGRSLVNLWQYPDDLPSAKLLIPESYLLSQVLPANEVLVQSPLLTQGKTQYIASKNFGCVSALQSTVMRSPTLFCASVGVNLENTVHSAETELAGRLIAGLMAAPSLSLSNFFHSSKAELKDGQLRDLLLPSAAIVGVYLATTSAWLAWQHHNLETQVAAEKAQLEQALTLQDNFNQKQSKLASLASFFQQQQPNALVLLTLASMIEDARIEVLRRDKGRFILIGKTHPAPEDKASENSAMDGSDASAAQKPIYKATEFLEKLISLPNVKDARFDAAVRKSRDYENFTVSFELQNPYQISGSQTLNPASDNSNLKGTD